MNSQVCVNCSNKKDVNTTNNRLVTESCGHVKCMECLLQEKSGCIACQSEINDNVSIGVDQDATNGLEVENEINDDIEEIEVSKLERKKPETPHIKVEIVGKTKTYECLVCNKKFQSRSMVAYHAYCNGQTKPYQCPITECNKSFTSLSYYRYHMRVHRDERAFPCDICGKSFFQKSKMMRHRMKHSKDKKYICEVCNKGFSNSTALRRHALTHTEERPYCCKTCGQRFRDSSNFRKHVFKHENFGKSPIPDSTVRRELRAHKCPRCPQAFYSRKDLRRHMQVHTDAKPYRCKACEVERRFRRKDNLDRHIRNTHPDLAPSMAAVCDETPASDVRLENGHAEPGDDPKKITDEVSEKKKLEILNPLPPLPQEVIEQHMATETETIDDASSDVTITEEPSVDKTTNNEGIDTSYILQANNARQSVIVETCNDRKNPSPIPEYVHKIRKANSMRCQKDTTLPPIDPTKIIELETKTTLNNLDIGVPLPKNIQTYKNILYDKLEKNGGEEETKAPEMHWRRKMKLGINW